MENLTDIRGFIVYKEEEVKGAKEENKTEELPSLEKSESTQSEVQTTAIQTNE